MLSCFLWPHAVFTIFEPCFRLKFCKSCHIAYEEEIDPVFKKFGLCQWHIRTPVENQPRHRRWSMKKLFLKISQYSQENTFRQKNPSGLQLYYQEAPNTGAFLWILQNFEEQLFWRTFSNGCICPSSIHNGAFCKNSGRTKTFIFFGNYSIIDCWQCCKYVSVSRNSGFVIVILLLSLSQGK